MKVEDSRAAARHWDLGEKGTAPAEPEEPGTIHAYLYQPDVMSESESMTFKWLMKEAGTALLEFAPAEAACGMAVRVIYRMPFDTEETDACGRCLAMVELWLKDRSEYHRKVEERHDKWAERDSRRISGQYTSESAEYDIDQASEADSIG